MKNKVLIGLFIVLIICVASFIVYGKLGWKSGLMNISDKYESSKVSVSVALEDEIVNMTIHNKTNRNLLMQYSVILYDESKNELCTVGCSSFLVRIFGVNAHGTSVDKCSISDYNINISDVKYYSIKISPSKENNNVY